MFYYFDKSTRRCAHMSSGELYAPQYLEIESDEQYADLNAIRYEEQGSVFIIVEDAALLAEIRLQEAKDALATTINHNITRWADVEEFGSGDEQTKAVEMSRKWREFRFKVERATELPLPPLPEVEPNE